MGPESTYCRLPAANLINKTEDMVWIYNANDGSGKYISGRPDADVLCCGKGSCDELARIVFIECKAAFGSLYLGNPEDRMDKRGFHLSQRNWWSKVAKPKNAPYFILTWLYPESNPSTVYQKNALLYLVPPPLWLSLEASISGRHNSKTAKLKEVEEHFAPCRVQWNNLAQVVRLAYQGKTWQTIQATPVQPTQSLSQMS